MAVCLKGSVVFLINIIFFPGVNPLAPVAGVSGRVQLRPRVRVLPAPLAHMPCVRDAGAESVRLPQTEQVLASTAQVHQADPTASAHRVAEAQS